MLHLPLTSHAAKLSCGFSPFLFFYQFSVFAVILDNDTA